MKAGKRIGQRTVDNGVGKTKLSAIEDQFDLQFPLRFELRGRTTGAFVLSKGVDRLKFVFGFNCKGIHSTLQTKQLEKIFDEIESGLKDLPGQETITFHMGSFSSDSDRQVQLSKVAKNAPSEELRFLMYGEKRRVQELTNLGVRKPKFLRIYVTYTIDPKTAGATDPVEKALSSVVDIWNRFTGHQADAQKLHYENLFLKAFTDGFLIWEQLISNKLGLDLQVMDENELWRHTWSRFNDSEPPQLPQLLTLTESGLKEEIRSNVHPTSLLIENQVNCPVPDRAWVHVKGKYVAPVVFIDKPMGWADKTDQLRYLWDLLLRDAVFDTEIFCQLSRANENIVKTNMQRLAKQSIVSAQSATSKQSVDVAAEFKMKKAITAQEQLYEGSLPVHCGVVVMIHRDNLDHLDEACRYMQSCIRRPAYVDREREYAWLVWLQTLPIKWDMLLASPFNRRMVFLTSEVPGFLPIVRPREMDSDGLELISEEGGVPIYIDLFNRHRHLALFATTRAGKSVLVSAILTQALSRNIPIVVLDFPTDTASTFKDYTKFLGDGTGAYFDIGKEQNNLFELPDLRGLPLNEQVNRHKDYVSFLESAMMTMVLSSSGDSADIQMLRKTIRSILTLLLTQFFEDDDISDRYTESFACGFGSPQWQTMPTLRDFLKFCTMERLEESDALAGGASDISKAMDFVRLQLKFWVNSRVGQAISSPSSFKTDSPLMVFALRNLSEDDDAAILSLSAYSVAYRNALKSPESIFFIDESPILFTVEDIAELVARLCANGAKAGVRVILSAQDPDTIARSKPAAKILQNLSTRLVGRIQPTAVPSFVKYLGYPEEIILRNSTEQFFPKREGVYSQWLIDDSGVFLYGRFYANYLQLAAVANNPHEQRARDAFRVMYPNWFEALSKFADELVSAMRNGRPMVIPTVDKSEAIDAIAQAVPDEQKALVSAKQ